MAPELTGGRVPIPWWLGDQLPADSTVLATYGFWPFGARTDVAEGFPIELANEFGLAPGDAVTLWQIERETCVLEPIGAAVVTDDGVRIVSDGPSIDTLSWLVVTG